MITILLSTYNGARFLAEQLASFERQTESDWRIVWRDDGSTDDTVAIMEEFSARTKRCTRIASTTARLGPTGSFLLLLREVGRNIGRQDIIVFSDQDDVWLPEKLERAKRNIVSESGCTPKLYFARQELVDKYNNIIGKSSKINFLPTFPECLAQNVAAGCTMALNYNAVILINKIDPPKETYHDWWCYIVVSACAGQCIYDNNVVIRYRQHSDNTIGAERSRIVRAYRAIRRGPKRFMSIFRAHIDGLPANFSNFGDSSKETIEVMKKIYHSNYKLFWFFLVRKIRRQNVLETVVFYFWVLLG